MYTIKKNTQYGRYVEAATTIKKGQVITACELLVLSPDDTIKVNQTELQYYTFTYNKTQDCLVLGDGEIFNHDDSPNVSYNIETINDRPMMVFKALNDIESGSQLFTDYSADVTSLDVSGYINNSSLTGV